MTCVIGLGLSESRFDHRHLAKPFLTMSRSSVISTLPKEPLVVLARSRPVVLDLLSEEFVFLHHILPG